MKSVDTKLFILCRKRETNNLIISACALAQLLFGSACAVTQLTYAFVFRMFSDDANYFIKKYIIIECSILLTYCQSINVKHYHGTLELENALFQSYFQYFSSILLA